MFLDEIDGRNIFLKKEIILDADTLETKYLVARARILKRLLDKNTDRLRVFKELSHKMSIEEMKQFLLKNQKKNFQGQGVFYYIYTKDKTNLIGFVELRIENEKAGRSVFIDKAYEGKGYAKEVLQLTESYLFEQQNTQTLIEACALGNESFDSVAHQVNLFGFKPTNKEYSILGNTYDLKKFCIWIKTKEMYQKQKKQNSFLSKERQLQKT